MRTHIYLLILLYMCPRTTICVGAAGAALVRGPCAIWADRREELVDRQARHCYICVRILLHMCPHTTIYVSAYYCVYICVLILLVCVDRREGLVDLVTPGTLLHMCPHTVSSYCCSSVAAVAALLQ